MFARTSHTDQHNDGSVYEMVQQCTAEVQSTGRWIAPLTREIRKQIIGQDDLVQKLLVGLLTGGHLLLEGLPGLAKTLSVKTLASAVQCPFQRIQFTPDMLPADIIGTEIYNPKETQFITKKGPIFSSFILADEINRAPAKVQSALLEAMQEKQVTIGETTYSLPEIFLVLATQNPIEQEGTYPLPEAQVDRFMLKVVVDYPSMAEEFAIIESLQYTQEPLLPVVGSEDILAARKVVRSIFIDDKVKRYIVSLVHATRTPEQFKLDLDGYIEVGASPRATINLVLVAQALAFLDGRGYVTPDDVKTGAPDVLRHRLRLSYEAEAEGITAGHIIQKILDTIPVP